MLILEEGETAHSICLEWVAQASGELCLDSSLPLLRFASVLQAANMPLLPNFRTVFGAAGGHRVLQNSRIQQITRWTSAGDGLRQLLVLGPHTALHS